MNTINEMDIKRVNKSHLQKLTSTIKEITKEKNWPENRIPKIKNHVPNIPRIFGKYKDHKNP